MTNVPTNAAITVAELCMFGKTFPEGDSAVDDAEYYIIGGSEKCTVRDFAAAIERGAYRFNWDGSGLVAEPVER